jgi:hypothetical protein
MKAHSALLAVSVLCVESAVFAGSAAAQVPAAPAEAPTTAAPAPEPAPAPAPAPAALPPPPPTPVDTPPSPPVNVPPPTPVDTPPSTPVNVPPPVEPIDPGLGRPRYRDAHHDRLLLAPTAETNPKGSFYATSYEIVLLQLGYSLSDTTQLSLTTTPPLGEEHVMPVDISIKTVLLREPHVSVAAIASASGILGFEEVSGFLGRAGAVASFCVDADACRLSFSMSSNIALIGPGSLLFNGAGLSFRAGRIVSLIAELDSLIPLGEAVGEANGLLAGVGVRLSGRAWGIDLALMRAGKARADVSDVVPFLAVTYRYVP